MSAAYKGKGTFASGSGDVTPGLPGSPADGDLMVLFVESANEAASAPSGWTALSPSGTPYLGTAGAAGGVRLDVFYRWWQSGDAAPTVTDTGNHTTAIIIAYSGVDPDTPFDGVTPVGHNHAATTSGSYDGVTTGSDNALVVYGVALDRDAASTSNSSSQANANLVSCSERHDQTVSTAAGGGLLILDGVLASAGASGAATSTLAASTAYAGITFSLRSAPVTLGYKSSSGYQNGSTTTTFCSTPSGVVDGDLMLCFMGIYDATVTVTPPAGWSVLFSPERQIGSGQDTSWFGFYKIASGEGGTQSFTLSSSEYVDQIILAYEGADTSDPIDAVSSNHGRDSGPRTGLSVTTTVDNGVLVYASTGYNYAPSGPPSGMTSRIVEDTVTNASDVDLGTAGATGDKTQSIASTDPWCTAMVAIKPASTGGGGGISGTSSITLSDFTVAATGQLYLQGATSINLADFTLGATGALANSGTASMSLADFTASGAGALLTHGQANITLADFTVSAAGIVATHGQAVITLADFTTTASGTSPRYASADINLADFTAAATGVLDNNGAVDVTLDDFTVNGAGALVNNGVTDITLDDFTTTASGTLTIAGDGDITLDDFTTTASGVLVNNGATDITLDDFTTTASGTLVDGLSGQASISLDDFTTTASGKVYVSGQAVITLDNFTTSGAADLNINGQANITLDAFTCEAAALLPIRAQADLSLAFTMQAQGQLEVQGSASITLEDFFVNAVGQASLELEQSNVLRLGPDLRVVLSPPTTTVVRPATEVRIVSSQRTTVVRSSS